MSAWLRGRLRQAAPVHAVPQGSIRKPQRPAERRSEFCAARTSSLQREDRDQGEWRTQAALKQLANKAASGDAAAIREVLRVQAAIAEIVPTEDQHDYTGKHGERPNPAETDPSRIALALLSILRGAQAERK